MPMTGYSPQINLNHHSQQVQQQPIIPHQSHNKTSSSSSSSMMHLQQQQYPQQPQVPLQQSMSPSKSNSHSPYPSGGANMMGLVHESGSGGGMTPNASSSSVGGGRNPPLILPHLSNSIGGSDIIPGSSPTHAPMGITQQPMHSTSHLITPPHHSGRSGGGVSANFSSGQMFNANNHINTPGVPIVNSASVPDIHNVAKISMNVPMVKFENNNVTPNKTNNNVDSTNHLTLQVRKREPFNF